MYRSYKDICSKQENHILDNTRFLQMGSDIYSNMNGNVLQTLDPAAASVETVEKFPIQNCNKTKLFKGMEDKKYYSKLPIPNKTKNFPQAVEKFQEEIKEHSSEGEIATDPVVWGPKAWDFLHTLSFSYPDNPSASEQQSAMNLFMSLPDMLPCKMCGDHCRENLNKNPPQVESKEALSRWLVDFHNDVNRQTNETKGFNKKMYTYEDAVKQYDSGGICVHSSNKQFNE